MKLISARASRAPAPTKTENLRARDLGAPLEIDDAERRAEVPVRLHVEGERSRRAMAAHFHVVGAALPDGHTLVRQVGNRQQAAIAPLLNHVELDAELLDLLRSLAIRLPGSC